MLDERKKNILRAIIDDYILTAEPIGSRTIARKSALGISSATIRNEMADLEESGFLEQPHTSAGRIPSAKGYRFYVDSLMSIPKLSENDMTLIRRWYAERTRHVEEVFQETVKILSRITQNISFLMVSPERKLKFVFKYLQFLPLDDKRIILVVVTDKGIVENRVIEKKSGVSFGDLEKISNIINNEFAEKDFFTIKASLLKAVEEQILPKPIMVDGILKVLQEVLNTEKIDEKSKFYFGGTTHMLNHPEYRNVEKVKTLLSMLEEERLICDILSPENEENGIIVTIGQENKYSGIKDCSVVQATYHFDGQVVGKLAVLGPTRMEYGRIMSILNFMRLHLKEVFDKSKSM